MGLTNSHIEFNLNSLKGIGGYNRDINKGDTRSLDYGSY